jgi:hypothetical protein
MRAPDHSLFYKYFNKSVEIISWRQNLWRVDKLRRPTVQYVLARTVVVLVSMCMVCMVLHALVLALVSAALFKNSSICPLLLV